MGESELDAAASPEFDVGTEAALGELATRWVRRLRDRKIAPLAIGLRGELGSGKTAFVRAVVGALGYRGRVPSPTYTLVEHYSIDALTVLHLDLYRLGGDADLENLGIRDWLAEPDVWLFIEWPERAPQLARRLDATLLLEATGPTSRRVRLEPMSEVGRLAAAAISDPDSN
jgi:tRNA threonylcarbamoyladenosine biosynthesis protein TsaE